MGFANSCLGGIGAEVCQLYELAGWERGAVLRGPGVWSLFQMSGEICWVSVSFATVYWDLGLLTHDCNPVASL